MNFNDKAIKRLKLHQLNSDICILASASFDFYVEQIANSLKFDYVVSTKSCWSKSGKLIPIINGYNLKGKYKLSVIKDILKEKLNRNHTMAYSDNIFDLPFLKYIKNAMVVNPNKQMKKNAQNNGFTILNW